MLSLENLDNNQKLLILNIISSFGKNYFLRKKAY